MKTLLIALRSLAVFTLLTGVVYPLSVTLFAQIVFPNQANGSLLERDGQVLGSALIAQNSSDPAYFWGRPSAVNTMLGSSLDAIVSSGGSNASPTSLNLQAAINQRADDFLSAHALADDARATLPVELLFASGSGLDPHISPQAARLQVARIAQARNLPPERISALVEQAIELPQLGFLGQPRVNVLRLNVALDALQ